MEYQSEIPEELQITLNNFPLLPGSKVMRVLVGYTDFYHGVVREVWSANPEYVVGGPQAEDAEVVKWTEAQRDEFKNFVDGGHLPVKLRLKKSMWVVIDMKVLGCPNGLQEKLYTYEIFDLFQTGSLIITER